MSEKMQLMMTEWHGVPGTYFRSALATLGLNHVRIGTRSLLMEAGDVYDASLFALEGWEVVQSWHEPQASGFRMKQGSSVEPGAAQAFVLLVGGGSRLSVKVAVGATSSEEAGFLVSDILEKMPKPDAPAKRTKEDQFLRVQFDVSSGRGTTLSVPRLSWEQIKDNYHGEARSTLEQLASMEGPTDEGRIIILHGPPGTGKTYAIRSILGEWADWADVRYLADPELLTSGEYMLSLITSEPSRGQGDEPENEEEILSGQFRAIDVRDLQKSRALVLVAEDAYPLLSMDGSLETGWTTISKVLNMGDGLMSHARPVYLLLTANVKIGKFHEAVSRPGRCLAKAELKPFEKRGALEWLTRKEVPVDAAKIQAMTLAQLYALSKAPR